MQLRIYLYEQGQRILYLLPRKSNDGSRVFWVIFNTCILNIGQLALPLDLYRLYIYTVIKLFKKVRCVKMRERA